MKSKFNTVATYPNFGFTLIELLVVIAIIGTLAAIVLTSLNSARGKGSDVAIKSNLANLRLQAETYLDNTGNGYYSTGATTLFASPYAVAGCGTGGGSNNSIFSVAAGAPNSLIPGIKAAVTANGGTAATCYLGTTGDVTGAGVKASKWAVSVQLKQQNVVSGSSGIDYWCVDYNGSSKLLDTDIATYSC